MTVLVTFYRTAVPSLLARPDPWVTTTARPRWWIGESRVALTDPERTLLDGLARPQYCGGFAEVLHALEVRGPRLDVDRIVAYALRLDTATAKRLGWVLERQGVDPERLEPLVALPVRGYRPLDPTGPRRGPCDRRWMVQENLPAEEAAPQPYLFQTPEITAMLERMWQKYKRHGVPLEDLQAELDQALGSRSLTGELCKMRGK